MRTVVPVILGFFLGRAPLTLVPAALLACQDGASSVVDEAESSVQIQLGFLGFQDGDAGHILCYDLQIEHLSLVPRVLATVGNPATRADHPAEAAADGAICVDPQRFPRDTGLDFATPCAPGARHRVTLWVEGVYEREDRDRHYLPACAQGCALQFDCPPRGAPQLALPLQVLLPYDPKQGFVDLAVDLATPPGVTDVCYDVRVTDANGLTVWSQGDPTAAAEAFAPDDSGAARGPTAPLCSSQYGAGLGSLFYVGPCDALATPATATVWVHTVTFDPSVPAAERQWQNPCPPDAGQAGTDADPSTWGGGCSQTFECLENQDAAVGFALDIRGPTPVP